MKSFGVTETNYKGTPKVLSADEWTYGMDPLLENVVSSPLNEFSGSTHAVSVKRFGARLGPCLCS